jgi:hypothetical protein
MMRRAEAREHAFDPADHAAEQDPASGVNVQYACFARDPADPIEGWDE